MKILTVRVGRVADTVMMTPALSALLQYYPKTKITLLTSPVDKHLLTDFHLNITDIWPWERRGVFRLCINKTSINRSLFH